MDQRDGTEPAPRATGAIPPRSRGVSTIAVALLVLAALAAANVASSALGFGYVATNSPLANALLALLIAMTPRFLLSLLQSGPDATLRTTRRTLAAAGATVRDLGWLLLLAPFLLLGGGLAAGVAEFLLSGDGRYGLVVVLVVGLVELRRHTVHRRTTPPPSGAALARWPLLRAAGLLWLLAWLGLVAIYVFEPWQAVGTDPRDGSRYFARPLRRDAPMERHTLLVATPLCGDAIAWYHVVAVEPSLPVDLTMLRFEGDAVFAERSDGARLWIALR